MKIYYTGADKFNAVQKDPSRSLGGYISSTIIPNSYINSIFSPADLNSIQLKKSECKCIAIQNEGVTALTGVELEILLDLDSICNYQIGFSAVGTDDCGNKFFESIQSSDSLPYEVEFQDVVSEETLNLPNLAAGDYLGIWLIRKFKSEESIVTNPDTAVPIKDCDYFKKIYDDSQVTGYVPPVVSMEEKIQFDFFWS